MMGNQKETRPAVTSNSTNKKKKQKNNSHHLLRKDDEEVKDVAKISEFPTKLLY